MVRIMYHEHKNILLLISLQILNYKYYQKKLYKYQIKIKKALTKFLL
jgi:hypothetical protein